MSYQRLEGLVEVEPVVAVEARTPLQVRDHPILAADGRALWEYSQGRFWVMPEADDDTFCFWIDSDGPLPEWMHFLTCDGGGLSSVLFPHCREGAQIASELLGMGVAPGQPFFIHLTFNYFRGDGWETDDDYDAEWTLLAVAPLAPDEAALRWDAWLSRRRA